MIAKNVILNRKIAVEGQEGSIAESEAEAGDDEDGGCAHSHGAIVPDAADHEEHDGGNQRDCLDWCERMQIDRVFVDNGQHAEGEQQSGFGEANPARPKI